ncbi:MAG: signal peptide peptidase SppA [Bacteroidales bacterium]|nr:signal peptide peptidase SppA [Bacteroidales bacterium]MCB9012621.1 signal peptide peptidase SppA [Bacteroidales bacterium]
MKSFLKFTLATIVGILLTSLIFLLILVGIISAASSESPVVVKPHTLLLADFKLPIVDRDPEMPFGSIDFMNLSAESSMGLNVILDNIDKASKDGNIDGIFMDLTTMSAGVASVEEIRNALIKFKESGKFIIAHADYYTRGTYYLASVADSIYLTPTGELPWIGLSSQSLFFKRALDKLGIDAQIIRAGEYKAAAEPFMYENLSKENREQITAYTSSIWNVMVRNVAASRSIDPKELNTLADQMTISNAKAALEYKMVDGLKYFDEVLADLKKLTSTDENRDIKTISLKKYTKVPRKEGEVNYLAKNKIAIIYAGGNIVTGEGSIGNMGADKIARTLREARRDTTIKAIVFRVNSGGGSALASEIIWREVKLASETKPLIASLGDVAASGGYYIVAPSAKIIASPNTITGSIGVIGILPNFKDFMNNKLGITSEAVNTNSHSDLGSMMRPLTKEEEALIQKEVLNTYHLFVNRVAQGRKLSDEQVDKIGRGHVYTAEDAKLIGLVDDFGGLEKSVKIAAEEANVTDYRIVEYPRLESPFDTFVKQFTNDVRIKIINKELGTDYKYYKQLEAIKSMQGIQAIMPFDIELF